jgi:uncharacterized protein YbaP (TraB family)
MRFHFHKANLCWFSALLLLATQLAHATPPAQHGIFWEISKPGKVPSYLFGTIHSEDSRVLELPRIVKRHFEYAESFTMEMLADESSAQVFSHAMFLPPEQSLRQLLTAKEYTQVLDATKNYRLPPEKLNQLKPWAVMALLNIPPQKTGVFLDLMLQEMARKQGKKLYGLETVQEQIDVFDSFTLPEQLILLRETLENVDESEDMFKLLHKLYLTRDLSGMLAFSEEQQADSEHPEMMAAFNKRLINDRNLRMLERMQPRLNEGNAFIAVGALHLAGKNGLLKLLEAQGYQVMALY